MSPHEVLGVAPDASKDDIKAAHRRLVKKYHPDRNPGDESARTKFDEVQQAYEALVNPTPQEKPTARAWGGGGGFSPFGFDFANGGFSFNVKPTVSINCRVSIADAMAGCEVSFAIQTPQGGVHNLIVAVPAGVTTGMQMQINAQEPDLRDMDIIAVFFVTPTDEFEPHGSDIIGRINLDAFDAITGGEFEVNTVHGPRMVTIPASTQPGTVLRLEGLGMPVYQGNGAHGSMLLNVKVTIPTLTDEEIAGIREVLRRDVVKKSEGTDEEY